MRSFCFVCQFFFGIVACLVASHADVLKGSSRVSAPRTLDKCSLIGAGTRDKPLRTSAWEVTCLDVLNPKSQVNTSERMFVGLKDVRKLKLL